MVGAIPLTTFTCDELLAERLADRSAPRFVGLSAPCPATVVAFACALAGSSVNPLRGIDPTKVVSLVMSQKTSYLFVDSSTGGERRMEVVWWRLGHIFEVVVTCPTVGSRGISECTVNKMSVHDIKVSDWLMRGESSPECKSLVVAAELNARRLTLLLLRSWCPWKAALLSLPPHVPSPSSALGNLCLDAPSCHSWSTASSWGAPTGLCPLASLLLRTLSIFLHRLCLCCCRPTYPTRNLSRHL